MTQFETHREATRSLGEARYWQIEMALADEAEREWRRRAAQVIALYRDADERRTGKRFNILWSNTETLRPALYARAAKPDVRRRFRDADPLGRDAAMLVERALGYCVDSYDIDRVMEAVVQDTLLAGRGVVWLHYAPKLETRLREQIGFAEDGTPIISAVEEDYIADQRLRPDYVYWEDFRLSPARRWEDVRWVARRHRMTRDELKREFPRHAADVPLDWAPDLSGTGAERTSDGFKRAEVWEIWHRDTRERLWLVRGFDKLLDKEPDPYGLEQFFPMPEPLYGVRTNDNMTPVPEYTLYQDQAAELDEITNRINRLVKALRRRGIYDGQIKELRQLADADDNQFVPVESFAVLMEKGGLAGVFQSENIAPVAQALIALYQQRGQTIEEIYQITGVSDLLRGSGDPRESATASRIKGAFGSMRMKARQAQVQRFVRDLYRLKAEIIAEHFEPDILSRMTGLAVDPGALQILRSDRLRSYAVDIETDSTVFEDAEQEKTSRIEFLSAVSSFAQQWLPVVRASPALAPLALEMLKFGVRGFKVGRQLEQQLDEAAGALISQAAQPQPDPAAAAAQRAAEAKMAKIQSDAAVRMRGQDIDAATAARGQDIDAELALAKLAAGGGR